MLITKVITRTNFRYTLLGTEKHMSLNFLDFEQPIAELNAKIEELELVNTGQELDLDLEEQITQLHEKK